MTKYEDTITKIERKLEIVFDEYIKNGGIKTLYYEDRFQSYEISKAIDSIFDNNSLQCETYTIGNLNLMLIDELLLKVDYNKTTLSVVEAITVVSPRRAEKILFELEHNKKPVEDEDEEDEDIKIEGEKVC